jgi:hypothetical protein
MTYRILTLVSFLGLLGHMLAAAPETKTLFNGKDLAGWETFLRGSNPGDPNYGLNSDPEKVFAVTIEDGGPVIRVSGKYWGGVITQEEYGNYHLRLEFKWGKKTWRPRANDVRDSGLLYHCVGPAAANANCPWPRSIEFNVTEHDTGEFWSVDNTMADAEVVPVGDSEEELAAFKGWCERNGAEGPKVKFRKSGSKQTFSDGGFMPGGDFEKPVGEWNVLDLYAAGDSSVHVVNGKVALVLTGLKQKIGNKEVPLTKGRIELQSESAEIFFRKIELKPIIAIPGRLLN